MTTPKIITHRGMGAFSHDSPFAENSLGAFRYALTHGADGVEFDVHLCADGHIVVHHDTVIERTTLHRTPGERALRGEPLAALSLAQLQSLKLKHGQGETIPTLTDVLDVCAEYGAEDSEFFIELKTPTTTSFEATKAEVSEREQEAMDAGRHDLVDAVASLLDKHGEEHETAWWERVHFLSFDPRILTMMRERRTDAVITLLEAWDVKNAAITAKMAGFEGVGVAPFFALHGYEQLAAHDLRVICGGIGIDEPMILKKVLALGDLVAVVDHLEPALAFREEISGDQHA